MTNKSSLEFKPRVAASPVYIGGASIEDMQKKYGMQDFIKLASNENPLEPSPLAIEAMQKAAKTLNRYPPIGDEELREALAGLLGHDLEADNFVTGSGGSDILDMIATGFLSPGDECIICRPTFPIYDITARRTGADVVYVDLDPEHFRYDVETILEAVTEKTRVLYLCSPNNPTGIPATGEQMETLVNNLPPQVLLVADEVYYHFATGSDFRSSLPYVVEGKNVVVVHSFSKAFGLAGLRLGYGVAPVEIAQYLARTRKPFHLNKFVMEGSLAAIRDMDHVEKGVAQIVKNRQWLYEQLLGLEVRVWPSQGNFILFQTPFEAAELSERLLQQGVIVRPTSLFYLPTHLRVTVGLAAENERFFTALQQALADMEAEGLPKGAAAAQDAGEFKF